MVNLIKNILKYGVMAPSGDNSQPWKFRINESMLFIYNLPHKDNPVLNFKQSGSYIAHGGLIENIIIASEHFGYKAGFTLFPDASEKNLVAIINFQKENKKENLFDEIKKRHTNRKKYKNISFSENERMSLLNIPKKLSLDNEVEVRFVEGEKDKIIAAKAGSSIEQVILENKELHRLLFKDIVWTKEEERKIKSGLYIETMEFNSLQKLVFRLASSWKRIKFLNSLGLSKFIPKEDTKLYATGAGMGVILIKEETSKNFINTGRVLQHIWLKATNLGMGLQPVSALGFAMQRIKAKEADIFSEKHKKIIEENYKNLANIFNTGNQNIGMLFRIGKSSPARARSSRKYPDIIE